MQAGGMKGSTKGVIIILVVGVVVFGYSQYASASQIGVAITQSELLEESDRGSSYNVELQFDNPSVLVLTAGESEFFVTAEGETVGQGKLDPFVLLPLNSALASGTFQANTDLDSDDPPALKISGLTKYDVWLASIEIPFVFYPTAEQTREFIDGS